MRSMSFEEAKRRFVHRFTMEHIPQWSRERRADGTFYAPQHRTDREWYDSTLFPGEGFLERRARYCHSTPSWPLGQSLPTPFHESQSCR